MVWDESKHPRDAWGKFTFSEKEKNINELVHIPLNFFSERGLKRQSAPELRRGIRKTQRRIIEHNLKVSNPSKHCAKWGEMTETEKAGLLEYWRKEIRGQQNAVSERIERLKELGENVDEYNS